MVSRETILVSVVIPNYNGSAFLETCLRSLERQTYRGFEVLLVDNASQDDSLEIVRRVAPRVMILEQSQNLGFSGGVNAGIRVARGEWIAVLNNDTEISEGWLEECLAALERHPDVSFLACRILDFTDRRLLYSAGDCFLRAGVGYRRGQDQVDAPAYQRETEIFSASGCAALYRKSALEEAGGFDKKFFAYMEDVELGLRMQATGAHGYYVPQAVVFHRGGATSGGEFSRLTVRLRTRNSVLMLLQSVPAVVFWRCLPMIVLGQASWLARVLLHGRLPSYLRGLAGVFPLLPAALDRRRTMQPLWQKSRNDLWQGILKSENMARMDFPARKPDHSSTFLHWYFRLFSP
jgi:GT2 family glycosyltransferase